MEQNLCFSSSKSLPCSQCRPVGKADFHGMHTMDGRARIDPLRQELSSGGTCSIQWLEIFLNPLLGWRKALLWFLRWFNCLILLICFFCSACDNLSGVRSDCGPAWSHWKPGFAFAVMYSISSYPSENGRSQKNWYFGLLVDWRNNHYVSFSVQSKAKRCKFSLTREKFKKCGYA